jgi:hypothetical protein
MSIAAHSLGEAAIAAQAGPPATTKTPPPRRTVVAQADLTQPPEAR